MPLVFLFVFGIGVCMNVSEQSEGQVGFGALDYLNKM